jgi:hypothetical protein
VKNEPRYTARSRSRSQSAQPIRQREITTVHLIRICQDTLYRHGHATARPYPQLFHSHTKSALVYIHVPLLKVVLRNTFMYIYSTVTILKASALSVDVYTLSTNVNCVKLKLCSANHQTLLRFFVIPAVYHNWS